MLNSDQLREFYPDLQSDDVESALGLVHSRFSTNTFPSWSRAHPYRMIAHNGEINTLQGNRNWMRAREALMRTPHMPNLERAFPIITQSGSDTASFDECLELLHLAGRPIWHAVLMMIPEAWENHASMSPETRNTSCWGSPCRDAGSSCPCREPPPAAGTRRQDARSASLR